MASKVYNVHFEMSVFIFPYEKFINLSKMSINYIQHNNSHFLLLQDYFTGSI